MSLIAAADACYLSAVEAAQRVHVDDSAAHRFSREVRTLIQASKGEADYPAWGLLAQVANSARWHGLYDPIPFASKTSTTAPLLRELMQAAKRLSASAPAHIQSLVANLRSAAEAYLASGNEPFAMALTDTLSISDRHQRYVVVRNRRTAIAVEQWMRSNAGVAECVLVPGEYSRSEVGTLAVLCGPSFVFPAQILTTPRASAVRLVHHHWVRDDDTIPGIFGQFATVALTAHIREPAQPAKNWQPWSGTKASELVINPDWDAVIASAPHTAAANTETVHARLAVLSGRHAIWLPSEGERIRGLDPSAPPGERVFSMPMSTVAQGSILVLRSGISEAATTRSVAYALLGDKDAAKIQRFQEEWKRRLRTILDEHGPTEVGRRLQSFGVNVHNIAHWASDELIQPRKIEYFKVLLLHILGISEPAPYIEAGRKLRRAVATAGHRLTEALERKADSCDLRQLEVGGVLELHLDELPGAAPMTAYQVLAIREELTKVALHDCRRPFATQGVEWLE
ncbi:hypothetical protein [Nonomuraea sp. NPDC049400]|uniref:hypothetical protein n=1 Tax=Nonomuraea sp. NPDC049400 TaxID=3364352 RepID=UPI00378A0EED